MSEILKNSAQRIQNILSQHNLSTKVVQFAESTRTAQEAALAIGCEVAQIAKTIIFKTKTTGNIVVVIASGKNRIDEKKIEKIVGEPIEKPNAEFVLDHTGFVIGGVPPIGYPLIIKPLIDQDLFEYSKLWAAAGTPHAVFEITPQDLVTITQGLVLDIKK